MFIFSGNRRINIGSAEPNTMVTKEGMGTIPTGNFKSGAEINSFQHIIMFISDNNRVTSIDSLINNARVKFDIQGMTQEGRHCISWLELS